MTMRCPYCLSYQVDTLNQAKKTGSAVGTVAGAASGASASFNGARVGVAVSWFACGSYRDFITHRPFIRYVRTAVNVEGDWSPV